MLPSGPDPSGDSRDSLTFHHALTRYAPKYLETFAKTMPVRHSMVLRKVLQCRTPAMGGNLFVCPDCGNHHYAYHSCNDRHCPQCGSQDGEKWLEKNRSDLLLPVPWYLVTFTLPDALRQWIRKNQKVGIKLLFKCSSRALQDVASNPKHFGGQLGMIGFLHTWSRKLIYHPHIHYLIPAGALSPDDSQWVPCRYQNFLLPVKALGKRMRTLFAEELQKINPCAMQEIPRSAWRKSWVVHSENAGNGENALRYLSRYLFKTATGNRRVKEVAEDTVLFPWRERSSGQNKYIRLSPDELLRRYLQHILPCGTTRVRRFGWLHPASRKRRLKVQDLLHISPIQESELCPENSLAENQPVVKVTEAPDCRCCGSKMVIYKTWLPRTKVPAPPCPARAPPKLREPSEKYQLKTTIEKPSK